MHLNLGILAHVDAGKTSLTEQLLYNAGVINSIGRVDQGNTQTDSLDLERQRGITIKSAVVSFVMHDVTINLIDTPGHPDFIAEVERVLNVLDGVVLVVSAVEGVQAQTRVLMRTLQRLKLPTLIFINKIDRVGAQAETLLARIAEKLSPAIIAMGRLDKAGSREARFMPYSSADGHFMTALVDLLVDKNDALMRAYVSDETSLSYQQLEHELSVQSKAALVHPVFFGSAMTGAGVDRLIAGLKAFLPAHEGDAEAAVTGIIFKVERGLAGEKVAYIRMFSGTIRVRDRLSFGYTSEAKVTAIKVFEQGAAVKRPALTAGQIGMLWGLSDSQIGDALGSLASASSAHHFAPPTLETVIVARDGADTARLHVALTQLAEQDPLINLRQDDKQQELFLSLYGEVQKEVIQATLVSDYRLEVSFRETTPICIERPTGLASAVEVMGQANPFNPFQATIGLSIEPAPDSTGIDFQVAVDVRTIPLYIFHSVENFTRVLEQTVRETLSQGLYGWQVSDCKITLTQSGYSSPTSTSADFRKLLPLVLMRALEKSGTQVCEPLQHFQLEVPADTVGPVLGTLARLEGVVQGNEVVRSLCLLQGEIPVARTHELQQQLPRLTRGEGVLEGSFARFSALRGAYPCRPRFDHNPLNRKAYLMHVLGWSSAKG